MTASPPLQRRKALEWLQAQAPPGTRLYAVLRRQTRTGSRYIDLLVIRPESAPVYLTRHVAQLFRFRFDWHIHGMRVPKDWKPHVELSRLLHPRGASVDGRLRPPGHTLEIVWI